MARALCGNFSGQLRSRGRREPDSNIDGRDDVLYTPRAGNFELGVASDGVDIVWREGPVAFVPGNLSLNELWTSSYTTDAASLAPRLVRDDLPGVDGTLGGGMYAYRAIHPDTIVHYVDVIDLADGDRRRYELPQDLSRGGFWGFIEQPLWVTPDEVAVPAARPDETGTPAIFPIRIDLTTLSSEAPTAPDAGL